MSRGFDGDVLVVGSDAVALALACDLRRAGVAVRVLDPAHAEGDAAPTFLPIGLRAPALEVLADLGVLDEVAAHATPVLRASVIVDGAHELGFDLLPGAHQGRLPVLVARAALERALEDRLEELGGGVDRGAVLCDVSLGGGGVYALERDARGSRTTRFRYVVDATGATHASLRVGFEVRHRGIYLASPVEGEQPPGVVTSFLGVGRAGGVVLPGLCHGSVAVVELERGAPPELAAAFAGLGAGERAPQPSGAAIHFTLRDAILGRFREGRVLFVGRGAHRQGPLDVQTTNFGLDDAHQLAWKLARVVRGVAAPDLLDSHDAERRPAVDEALQQRARERRLLRAGSSVRFSRRGVLLRALEHAFTRDRMTRRWQRLAGGLPERTWGEGARLARVTCRSVPDGAPTDLGDVVAGPHFTLLARIDDDLGDAARAGAAARDALGDDLGVVALSTSQRSEVPWADWTLSASNEELARCFGSSGDRLVLVRPDRRIAYAGPADAVRLLACLGPVVAAEQGDRLRSATIGR